MESDRLRALGTARLLAALLAAGPLLALALGFAVGPLSTPPGLVVVAGVIGLVAPAVAWRVQARIGEQARGSVEAGRRAYVHSVVAGLAITEAAAILGVIVWTFSREVAALIGLPMHLLLVGAIWPTEERLQRAEGDAS